MEHFCLELFSETTFKSQKISPMMKILHLLSAFTGRVLLMLLSLGLLKSIEIHMSRHGRDLLRETPVKDTGEGSRAPLRRIFRWQFQSDPNNGERMGRRVVEEELETTVQF
jgi:hypothetical protein